MNKLYFKPDLCVIETKTIDVISVSQDAYDKYIEHNEVWEPLP